MFLNRLHLNCLLIPLLAVLVGCQSVQPPPTRFAAENTQSLLANLPSAAFATFPVTNTVPRQWLLPSTEAFILGPGDVLDVEILGEPTSHAKVTVGPDGKIYYSLLPGTFVWGMTIAEAKEALENQLAKFLRLKPEVGLSLSAAISQRVWLLGEVAAPGVYPLSTPKTLLEAISFAGGPATNHLSESFVIRKGQRIPIDLARLLEEGDLSQNIYLQPDDFVYLQTTKSHEVYVMGAVTQPIAIPFRRGVSLATAISYAGGPIPYAAMSQVAIVRGSLTRPSIATINFNRIRNGELTDIQLEPGDLVYVPISTFYRIEILLNTILDTFVRTIAVNEGQNAVARDLPGITPTIPVIPLQ
jgi:polysaccharide biosynthesis/export protein